LRVRPIHTSSRSTSKRSSMTSTHHQRRHPWRDLIRLPRSASTFASAHATVWEGPGALPLMRPPRAIRVEAGMTARPPPRLEPCADVARLAHLPGAHITLVTQVDQAAYDIWSSVHRITHASQLMA
jgi:hypothetical protein